MSPDTSVQSKDGVGGGRKGRPRPGHRKSETRSRIFRELVHIAAEQGAPIALGVSTGDALQQCLDRAVAIWRFAADQVDSIMIPEITITSVDPATGEEVELPSSLSNLSADEDPFFEVIKNPQGPDIIQQHRYVTMEREARIEIEKLAAMMTQLGIAERVVRVEAAKAALMVAAIREAAIEVGLEPTQVRALGAALRNRVAEGLGQTRQAAGHFDDTKKEAFKGSLEIENGIDAS
jgi:hypothetical protein